MAAIDVLGGDFAKGIAAFHRGSGFLLRDKDGKADTIPLCRLQWADHASEVSLEVFGAFELRADLAAAESESQGRRVFIAIFVDGRLLLASTDETSFQEICKPRGCDGTPESRSG